jgi:Helix-turn-helix domain
VSVEAISWALNLAPVPADRGGQPSSACKFVLVGLANHAGPDGTGAFPSVATLVRYTGLSERTVRTCLDRLRAESIISPCDPDIVAAWIKRADRRPQGWDLNLSLVRYDLGGAAVAVLDRHVPGLGGRLAPAGRPGADDHADGVHSPHHRRAWHKRSVMSAPVASKIRKPSRPSMATSAKSHKSGDWPAAVSSASNCRCVNPKVGRLRWHRRSGGRAQRVNGPAGHR